MTTFSRMRLKRYHLLKIFFQLICEVYLAESQKIFKFGSMRQHDEETEYFEKKPLSSFKKASLPKWEGAKYAGGSRPSSCDLYLKKYCQLSRAKSWVGKARNCGARGPRLVSQTHNFHLSKYQNFCKLWKDWKTWHKPVTYHTFEEELCKTIKTNSSSFLQIRRTNHQYRKKTCQ